MLPRRGAASDHDDLAGARCLPSEAVSGARDRSIPQISEVPLCDLTCALMGRPCGVTGPEYSGGTVATVSILRVSASNPTSEQSLWHVQAIAERIGRGGSRPGTEDVEDGVEQDAP